MGAAVALAGAVLALTLLLGGGGPAKRANDPGLRYDPAHAPTAFPEQAGGLTTRTATLNSAGGYVYERVNERGQVMRVFGETFEPKAQFVSKIGKPGAEIFLTPRRVIRVTADQGSIYAPENQPQSGQLEGNVKLVLLEGPADRPVDLLHPTRDVKLRVTFDEPVKFDVGLGQLDSPGRVLLEAAGVSFDGSGLTLIYNEKRSRIDRMEIARGRSMRFRPTAQHRRAARGAGESQPATAQKEQADHPVQFYRARFDRRVRVTGGDIDSLEADQLAVVFSLGRGQDEDQLMQDLASDPATEAKSATATAPDASDRPTDLEEIELTWSGSLLVEPQDAAPPDVTEPSDVLVTFLGRPTRIAMRGGEVVTAPSLDYAVATGRLRAVGSDTQPVVLDAPGLGVLESPRLEIVQDEALGQLAGPGRLYAHAQQTLTDRLDPAAITRAGGLPRGYEMTWQHRVDLTFHRTHDASQLAALKGASFRGDVAVSHPQFRIRSDLLAINLQDPKDGPQTLRQIDASGGVAVTTSQVGEQPPLDLTCQTLRVSLDPDESGRLQPSRLTARGDVKGKQPGRALTAGQLDVMLGRGESDNDVAIRGVEATQGVAITLDDPKLSVTAARLTGDAANQLELFGDDTSPAILQREEGSLRGRHVVLNQNSRVIHVMGPGRFAFRSTPRHEQDEPFDSTITWQKNMSFDHRSGQARFIGEALASGVSGLSTLRVESDELAAEFIPETIGEAIEPNPLRRGFAALRQVHAKGDAVLLATGWQDAINGKVASRVRVSGPHIAFDNFDSTMDVLGAGAMLVEDYRPGAPDAGSSELAGITMSGRGATLLLWKDRLRIDALHNDMTLTDTVRMLHKPADGGAPAQLDCQYFQADLEAVGDAGAWTSRNPPRPNIAAIVADRDVRVLAGDRTVTTDHLRYNGVSRVVTLWSVSPRRVEIFEKDNPQPIAAERFVWDLARDRVEIERPGPGRATLPDR